jgi:hypothetical protein
MARDHTAPVSTLALAKATSLGRGRVRPLAWCSRPRSSTASLAGAQRYLPTMKTVVPTSMRLKSHSASEMAIRMQPCESE